MENLSRIVVLISGTGSNLQAIIDACAHRIIPGFVAHVISNREGVYGLERAHQAGIPSTVIKWQKNVDSRFQYDERVAIITKRHNPTLVVLAGWMHLFGEGFLKHFEENQVINLHPALPGAFPGAHAIEDAFADGTPQSGVMVHTVVQQMDAGVTLAQFPVARLVDDTLADFRERIRYTEKTVLVNGILIALQNLRNQTPKFPFNIPTKLYSGKVRDVYDIGSGMLLIDTTDRCSAFDRYICNIPQKGNVINRISAWWFERTGHIIDNHMVHSFGDEFPVMIVKRCTVFPIEFVVRGYITGTTNTAMWTLYSSGVRRFGNCDVADGLHKNEQLEEPIVTPTTKSDDHDEPIDRETIIQRGLMSAEEYDYCHDVALRLFECGQLVAAERGLILVDTKYEFGVNPTTNRIMLVDEIHTCDSSRYWRADTYDELFELGVEPDRFDKDMIRVYVKAQCDPYDASVPIPPIPNELIEQVSNVYETFYKALTGKPLESNFATNNVVLSNLWAEYYTNYHPKRIVVMCDEFSSKVQDVASKLRRFNIFVETETIHPFRQCEQLLQSVRERQNIADNNGLTIIYAVHSKTKATRKALAEMIVSASTFPVVEIRGKRSMVIEQLMRIHN